MAEAAGAVLSAFKALYARIDDMKISKTLAAGLRQRLVSLETPIMNFTQRSVTETKIVERLVNKLQNMGDFLNELQNRGCCRRLVCGARSEVEELDRFDLQVTGCVADFHLLLTIEQRGKNDNKVVPLTAVNEEVKENREALQKLNTEEAIAFYKKAYKGLTEISWEVFWHNFEENLAASHIQPSFFVKAIMKEYCDVDTNGQVSVEELDKFFLEWRRRKDELIRKAEADQKITTFVDDYQSPYSSSLKLRVKYVAELYRLPLFQQDEEIIITSKGLPSLPPTRIIRFGKGNPTLNHISFSPDDPGLDDNMFQIYANRDGFYIIDAFNSGNIRLKKGEVNVLSRGHIVLVGNTILHVLQASEILLQVLVFNGGGEMQGRTLNFEKRPSDSLEVAIGKSKGNQICFESDDTLSRVHAKIINKYGQWIITDSSANGTWINLMNIASQEQGIPSPPRKLRAEEVIGAELYRFEVISV
jgi:hypothetical protein